MPLLVNPGGRLVVVDDPKEYDYWLNQPGFKKATPQEEKEYIAERLAIVKAKELERYKGSGIYLATVSIGGADGYGIAADLIKRGLEGLEIPITRYYNDQKVAIIFHAPTAIAQVESPYRIVYTMFESTKIPDSWIPFLKEADLVIVPTKWCQGVFKASGIDTKVIPLGYDDTVFKFKPRENKRKKKKTFNFLHYNAFNVRKGFMELFKAFTEEFQPDEPVKLILKTTGNTAPIPIAKSQYPNIDVIYGKSSNNELLQIIYDSDCFVFPSRGEGFGFTPLECMATGIPAIVPNAHGISEYFNPDYMYEVKIGAKCPGLYRRYQGQDVGEMVVCDVKHLKQQMRYVYEHQDEAIKMGEKASEYVKQWSFRNTAIELKKIYEEALETPIKERKLYDVLTLEKVK